MQHFTIGQEVVVKQRWGTQDDPRYENKIVLGIFRKSSGYCGNKYIEDPSGNYVMVADKPREHTCNTCDGTGEVRPVWAHVESDYRQKCGVCAGDGVYKTTPFSEYVVNRKDHIMSLDDFEPIRLAMITREENKKKAQEAYKQNRDTAINRLVAEILEAEDKELAAAEFIQLYGYTSQPTHKSNWVRQSTLYEAAGKVREDRREAAKVGVV